jgi:molybdopterin molybdotransferase
MSNPSASRPFDDVRMRGFTARTPVSDGLGVLRERMRPLAAERIAVAGATGRVLATSVVAGIAVPHFDRAAFDGYAVRAADTAGARADSAQTLRVVGEALPARPFATPLGPGEAIRIMTGSPMPAGADAVLPAEHSDEREGLVTVRQPVSAGKNVGHVGEDVPAGHRVLDAGRRLRPQDLGLLVSIGVAEIDVVRRPRVAVVITGDELLPPGSTPAGFQIVDSNSVVLRALVERDGGVALPTRQLPDRLDAIRSAIASDGYDVLLLSGGTSVGREDYGPRLVAELGELVVHGMALKPGGPAGIGFVGGRPVFLLPGNPVACLCAYDLFAGRAVRLLGGRSDDLPYRTVQRPVAAKLGGALERVDYVRVIDAPDGVRPVPASGASILSTTVIAHGFVLVPPERDGYAPGERVTVHRYED